MKIDPARVLIVNANQCKRFKKAGFDMRYFRINKRLPTK